MFGRNRQSSKKPLDERSWRWRRRERRRPERNQGGGREAFGEFLSAIGNVARGQAFYFADRYRNQAADVVENFALSLRDVGEQRTPDDNEMTLAEEIADDLEDLSDAIRDIRLTSALSEVERLLRRRPVAFGIGALAAGYLITRSVARNGRASTGRRGGGSS